MNLYKFRIPMGVSRFYAISILDVLDSPENNLLPSITEKSNLNNNVPLFNSENVQPITNSNVNILSVVFLYLFIIIAIVIILFLMRKFLLGKVKGINGGAYIRLHDRMIISQDKQIAMIEVADKILVVGITNHTIQTLYTMDKSECTELDAKNSTVSKFGGILAEKMNFNKSKNSNAADNKNNRAKTNIKNGNDKDE